MDKKAVEDFKDAIGLQGASKAPARVLEVEQEMSGLEKVIERIQDRIMNLEGHLMGVLPGMYPGSPACGAPIQELNTSLARDIREQREHLQTMCDWLDYWIAHIEI